MLHYPMLSDTTTIQYPSSRLLSYRNVEVQSGGGHFYVFNDPGWVVRQFNLAYRHLTNDERETIQTFFDDAEGEYRSFTFIDAFDNLLKQSSQPQASFWTSTAGLIITTDGLGPSGTLTAHKLSNPTLTPQRVFQDLPVYAGNSYTLSVMLRSTAGSVNPTLFIESVGETSAGSVDAATAWSRVSHSSNPMAASDLISVGIEISPLTEIVVEGFQLEVGRMVSTYKDNNTECGVYPKARFRVGELEWITEAVNSHSTHVSIHATY